jgi:sugar lactone lactonase YvrE
MKYFKSILRIAIAAIVLATSAGVAAVTTTSFVLDGADSFFDGELDGTAVHSDGAVRLGASTERLDLENVPLAYSVARRGKTVFVGTGTNGIVYQIDGKKVKQLADTGELLVSSLAFGRDGALYAGTLPNGVIYRIDPKSGKAKRFSTPKGVKHVWSLVYDKKRGKLIAGTGPEGKIFTIDGVGQAKELFQADGSSIMTMALDGSDILAGTSDSALLLRIEPNGKATVVRDLPGNEVTAIDVLDGRIAVAVNQFKGAPGTQFKGETSGAKPGRRGTRPRPGSGQLWRIEKDGRAEMLMARKDTHFTDVEWGNNGSIYVAGGQEGRIFEVHADASYSIWADVDERQILAIDLRSDAPIFVTGDSGAVYRVLEGSPKNAVWTSKALDAAFLSKWGRLDWRGTDRFVFQTRSGNTKEPGDTWSAWSKDMKSPGRVSSPPARFIQVRAKFPKSKEAELRAMELYYLPQNQRPRVFNVRGMRPARKPGEPPRQPPPPTTLVNVTWQVENPDRDIVRYRLAYRADGQTVWRDMFTEDVVLTDTKYTWNAESIPDGHYAIRVEASDEPSNPPDLALRSESISELVTIDNHPPRIEELRLKKGQVEGRVVDSLGPIARVQMSIDAGPWQEVFPKDTLFDGPDERFQASVSLSKGPHIIAVRAFDAAGNQANRELSVTAK